MRVIASSLLLVFVLTLPVFAQATTYTCPMHPHYVADEMGTCPICGMDLVPLEVDEPKTSDAHGEHADKNGGRPSVTIKPEIIQNTGIRTERAKNEAFGNHIRSYGDVTENIRLQYDIAGRVEGWIGNLKIQAVGDSVTKGDMLFTLYSPSLVSAQRDYVSAMATGVKGRIESGAKRLASLGVQNTVIEQLKKTRNPFENVPFYAEVGGVVSMINIRDGSYVKPGMTLISLQDYSSIWIDANIAEKDIPYISDKTMARVSFPTLGISDRKASIDYIYPTIDKATRTGRVRLVLDNPEGILKPGAYVDIEFETDVKNRLSVPSESVLKSKSGDYVIIAQGDGRFEPRKVEIGLYYKNKAEVISGLSESDNVVISGQFLIDSESSLRESFNKMRPLETDSSESNVHENH